MGGDAFDWLDAQQEFSLKPQCTNLKYTLVSCFYSDCMVVNLKIMTKDLIMWSTYIETYKFFLPRLCILNFTTKSYKSQAWMHMT